MTNVIGKLLFFTREIITQTLKIKNFTPSYEFEK